jgi:hypothetical protein
MRAALFLLLLLPLTAGCGSEPYQVASVSGRVTLNGNPLPKATVSFAPIAVAGNPEPGPGSNGTTDENGRYSLRLLGKDRSGAVVGKHKVRITMANDRDPSDDRPVLKLQQLPLRYNGETKLEFDVPVGGTDQANFDLKSP